MAAAGIDDILISNEIVDPAKIDRLAGRIRLGVCVDDARNVADLSAAAFRHGCEIACLVEIDCGAARCGVGPGEDAVVLAQAVEAAPRLRFAGLLAYNGNAQHIREYYARKEAAEATIALARSTVALLEGAGLVACLA